MLRIGLKLFVLAYSLSLAVACWAGDVVWIDVRTAQEFAGEHVDGAFNIPYEEITQRIAEVTTDRDAEILLYCRSGRRAGIAKTALEGMGYTHVVNLKTVAAAQAKAAELSSH